MESEGLLLWSQQPATSLYPELEVIVTRTKEHHNCNQVVSYRTNTFFEIAEQIDRNYYKFNCGFSLHESSKHFYGVIRSLCI
jgi:hypothetical protein